ncbi:YheC/YheD family protein [Bacillus sp. AK128]
MVTIGMLHFRKHPETVKKAYAYAAAAKMEGVQFYYFSFSKVNFQTKQITGYKYEQGSWIQESFPFPDVIYNAGSAKMGMQYEVEQKLREMIPFTSHSIGNKMSVYKRILEGQEFKHYLLESTKLQSISLLHKLLQRFDKAVIKPVSGRKGENVLFVEKLSKDEFRLLVKKRELKLGIQDLNRYVLDLLSMNEWLIQPYLKSITKDGHPYDFRLHVQKNGEGVWQITTIYPRVTIKGIVANISGGGYTNLLEDFLRMEYGSDYYNMKRYLERFAVSFAEHFDSLYDESLDELGIDIGIDDMKKAWIYEVNWRPGTPPTYSLELDVARNTVQYAKFLHEQKANENTCS